ncbi:SDR family NAD(P)-dependent oxidoreductase [Nocardia blacklockiae]|uniref:SDR family NAD(P)-dependent oxidoreductase n=1 Tax=Nocardia blacklockiae TaxID=480036 RepID=UPI001895E862|nr:SDR family NAD(P)-dependent oxidoreductase [Nocardia blacklockiae]MBF6170184.1 SDR family NAD(P)-dependent oxidoreductase [Nocardia blacklockiae]
MGDERLLAGTGAVVVGGGSGIGRAVAETLAAHGAGVVVNSRTAPAVDRAAAAIRAAGGRAVPLAGSAADESVAERLVETCVAEYGAIDVLVNCAAVPEPPRSSILDVRQGDWRELLDAHLATVFNTCRAAAPRMAARGSGSIVNTGSFAYLGDYGGTGYPAGKGAVASLTLAVAADLKEYGVRANVVCPGAKTRLSTGADFEAHIRDLHRRGLLDEATARASLDAPPPEYAAALYLYLASDAAREVSGAILIAAGGFVGRFERPVATPLGYRDHADQPPWTVDDLARMVGR